MKIAKIFIPLFIIATLLSCNKYDFNYPPGTVGISKIIYFPSVAIIGQKLIIIKQGASFTDPGATALLNGVAATYVTAGTVDPTTPGVYGITYTASNPQGYTASD